ncbi:MAG TPA: hypothetical protein VMA83_02150 [Solirubrobacteraceae bacterium]|nr:hypothetical protein [Solirubrobacteraceae bacterium]
MAMPTAPVAAGTFVASWAVVEATGSRALGGVVLAAGGLWCLREWDRRRDRRTALALGAAGLGAFALSHLLALLTGAWPAVVAAAIFVGAAAWLRADLPRRSRAAAAR